MLTEKELLAKLTIGIPVYNDHEFIGKTLDSCVGQAGQVLLYDNGSEDGTSEICAAYARKYPHIKHTRHDKNIGSYENFRRPLFDCRTEYFQWVGSHDILGQDFSLNLLRALEKDASGVLAFGRIAYMDEKGSPLKIKDKSHYTMKMLSDDPFERMKSFLSDLRDCIILYGIFRAEPARKSWAKDACIGWDDTFLLRAVSQGKFIYTQDSTFFCRAFPLRRKNEDARKRQAGDLANPEGTSLEKNLREMVSQMMGTITTMPQYADNLGKGFQVFDALRKRYLEPRQERKARRNRLIFLSLFFLTFIALLITGALYSRCR
jgi:glycosyltransferase involved in cell wall biosynthesis